MSEKASIAAGLQGNCLLLTHPIEADVVRLRLGVERDLLPRSTARARSRRLCSSRVHIARRRSFLVLLTGYVRNVHGPICNSRSNKLEKKSNTFYVWLSCAGGFSGAATWRIFDTKLRTYLLLQFFLKYLKMVGIRVDLLHLKHSWFNFWGRGMCVSRVMDLRK